MYTRVWKSAHQSFLCPSWPLTPLVNSRPVGLVCLWRFPSPVEFPGCPLQHRMGYVRWVKSGLTLSLWLHLCVCAWERERARESLCVWLLSDSDQKNAEKRSLHAFMGTAQCLTLTRQKCLAKLACSRADERGRKRGKTSVLFCSVCVCVCLCVCVCVYFPVLCVV